jgi:hypothetical protein
MMRKAANEKKSKRICYSVLIVPHYEGRARQFRVSRFAIYGVIAACVIILSAVGFVVAQNYSLRNTVAQYKGMSLDEVVRLQTAQLDAANEALTKSNQELDALKQYVGYLSKLDQQVRKTLGVANVNVTLASILEQRSTPTLTVNRGLAASGRGNGSGSPGGRRGAGEEPHCSAGFCRQVQHHGCADAVRLASIWPRDVVLRLADQSVRRQGWGVP